MHTEAKLAELSQLAGQVGQVELKLAGQVGRSSWSSGRIKGGGTEEAAVFSETQFGADQNGI